MGAQDMAGQAPQRPLRSVWLVHGWPSTNGVPPDHTNYQPSGPPSYKVVVAETEWQAKIKALESQEGWQHPAITNVYPVRVSTE